jgi:hypothetical protein
MTVSCHCETLGFALAVDALHQGHRLGGGGCLIQQRRVSEIHAGEIHHHLLEGQQDFQTALRNLGLVGCIGGVPARIFQHIALDNPGSEGVVVPHANHRAFDHILIGIGAQLGDRFLLAECCG